MRRGRRRRRPSARRKNTAGAVLVVMVILGLVYVLSAGVAGKWMADNVIAPIFEAFSGGGTAASPAPTGGEQTEQQVAWKSFTLHCVQMGVFSSEDNARELAGSLKAQGAAGYLMTAGGNVRVLVSAYPDRQDALDVRDRLIGAGMDCTVYTLTCPALEITVTADKTRIPEIQPIFDRYQTAMERCGELAVAVDDGSMSQDAAQAEARTLARRMEADAQSIDKSGYAASNEVVRLMLELCTQGAEQLDVVAEGTEFTLPARLRYASLALADGAVGFVRDAQNGLSGQ